MAVTIYYENDVDPKIIQGKKVAIIGYGSQGHAHALNLMDSGVDVRVGLREGSKSWAKAEEAGLKVTTMDQAAEEGDIVMILVPDELQPEVYEQHIASHLKAGNTLAFAHGFNIHYGYIKAPEDVNVVMCAPKGPGHIVRRQYTEGSGVPDLACVYQDATGDAWDIIMSYCWGVGGARSGIIKATFAQETEEDLFGEQAVINEQSREAMKEILHRIQNGDFAREFVADCKNDHKWLFEQREAINSHEIEKTGAKIRGMFSWVKSDEAE